MTSDPTQQNADLDLGRAYTKKRRWLGEMQFSAMFLAILLYSLLGLHNWSARFATEITTNFYLQALVCWTFLWVACLAASLPVSVYHFFVDRKFRMAKLNVYRWFLDLLKAKALLFVFGATIVEIVFFCGASFPEYGWVLAGILCSVTLFAAAAIAPWLLSLFYPVRLLENPTLRERLVRLAAKAKVSVGPVYEWQISARTRAANALVAGIGSSRRILLTDTLLSVLSEDEVEAIVAHELGHCALNHTRKRLLVQSLIFIAILGGIDFAVRNDLLAFVDSRSSWRDLSLLPGFFLYWNLANVYGRILLGSVARKNEKAADLFSWQLVGRAEPFITAMRKLLELNLIVFDKNSEWKYMHPATADRIAAAEQYAKARGEPLGASGSPVAVGPELG